MSQKRIVFIIAAATLIIFIIVLVVELAKEEEVLKLIPVERPAKRYSDVAGTEVGTGSEHGFKLQERQNP